MGARGLTPRRTLVPNRSALPKPYPNVEMTLNLYPELVGINS